MTGERRLSWFSVNKEPVSTFLRDCVVISSLNDWGAKAGLKEKP